MMRVSESSMVSLAAWMMRALHRVAMIWQIFKLNNRKQSFQPSMFPGNSYNASSSIKHLG